MSIKAVLDSLSDKQRRLLMYAFEHGIAQHIELPSKEGKSKKFIGVNVKHIKHLEVSEEAGNWAIGEVKGGEDGD